jgi:carbonic anhydrase
MGHQQLGLIDNWLRHIRDLYHQHFVHLHDTPGLSSEAQEDELTELNVRQSFLNVCSTSIVQAAWARGQPLRVHGWVYSIRDGLLKEIDAGIASQEELHEAYQVGPPRSLKEKPR